MALLLSCLPRNMARNGPNFPVSCDCDASRHSCNNSDTCLCRHYGFLCSSACRCTSCTSGCSNGSYARCDYGSGCTKIVHGIRELSRNCACARNGRTCIYVRNICVFCECRKLSCGNGDKCPDTCKCENSNKWRICQCLRCSDDCGCHCKDFVPDDGFIDRFVNPNDRDNTFALLIVKSNRTADYLRTFKNTGDKSSGRHAEENATTNLLSFLYARYHPKSCRKVAGLMSDITEIALYVSRCPCYHHGCNHPMGRIEGIDQCEKGGAGHKCAKLLADVGRIIKFFVGGKKLHKDLQLSLYYVADYNGQIPDAEKRELNRRRTELLEENWRVSQIRADDFREVVHTYTPEE